MGKYTVLLTGGAGFIGSNIAEALLKEKDIRKVIVLDNLSTGFIENIQPWFTDPKFQFIKGDIRNYDDCLNASKYADIICHQAALGSVPRSIKDPRTTHDVNITGTLNIFTAAKENGIQKIVYAASSSTYGDNDMLPKKEENIGKPLSPYAVTKYANELYAEVYSKLYGIDFIGLRYFNVFGPRQNPHGPYAAVIPLFISSLLEKSSPVINGDGTQTRDFTYVENAVQANLKAIFCTRKEAWNQVYNVASGEQTSINDLYRMLRTMTNEDVQAVYGPSRPGDVKYSLADVSKAKNGIGFIPHRSVKEGVQLTLDWFINQRKKPIAISGS